QVFVLHQLSETCADEFACPSTPTAQTGAEIVNFGQNSGLHHTLHGLVLGQVGWNWRLKFQAPDALLGVRDKCLVPLFTAPEGFLVLQALHLRGSSSRKRSQARFHELYVLDWAPKEHGQ